MSKYFTEEKEPKILLSSYIKESQKKESYQLTTRDIKEVEYLKQYLGDVSLKTPIIKELCSCFHSFGGRYSVRSDIETIQGLYEIISKYEDLSATAIEDIAFIYIKDLFDEYDLKDALSEYIKKYGKTDEAFEKYYSHIETCAEELQAKYDSDAKSLKEKYHLEESYSKRFIEYLEDLIKSKHFDIAKIIECLPDPQLVSEDEKQLKEIAKRSHDYFGVGYPASYTMTKAMIKYGTLEQFSSQPKYYVSISDKSIPATFTTEEFISSIKETKKFKKIRK